MALTRRRATPTDRPPGPYTQQWLDRGTDRVGLQWYAPPADPTAPVVVLWPAMGVPARFYRPFATALRQAGPAVVVADLRGTGASTPRASRHSRYGYAELVDDVQAVLAQVRRQWPERPPVLLGHSLGGQLCLLHLARAGRAQRGDPAVAGLVLVGVGLPYWRSYPGAGRLGILGFTQGIWAATAALRVWPGWGFGGRQARGVIRDWAATGRTGTFPPLSGVDTEAAMAAVDTPVLAVSLQRDRHTPASTVDQLVGKLPAAAARREHYPGPADHFSWARTPGPIAERVAAFTRR